MVLEKSNSTLGAIILGLPEAKEVKPVRDLDPERMHARTDRTAISSPSKNISHNTTKGPALRWAFSFCECG